jgi:hypothetical protein
MKTITIDGEEYVLKKDVETAKPKTGINFLNNPLLWDEANVMAIGTCQIGAGYIATVISTEYLEKVIKCLKAMSMNKKGLDKISIAWANNSPAVIGKADEKGIITGFIIAPRVDEA